MMQYDSNCISIDKHMHKDIFEALDEQYALELRGHLSERDAVALAMQYNPHEQLSIHGNARQMRLFRKLDLIQKAAEQEAELVAQCHFVFTHRGARTAKQLKTAHLARVNRRTTLRSEISVLLRRCKQSGLQGKSDEALQRTGVKSRRVHDIKNNRLEEIHRELTAILGQSSSIK